MTSVVPIVIFVLLLEWTLVPFASQEVLSFLVGAFFVFLGLVLFLSGIKVSLLQFGEAIGKSITLQGKVWMVVVLGFLVGFVVTVAEPDVQVLARQVDLVSSGAIGRYLLVLFVALGVGIFVAFSLLRILFNIPLLHLLIGGYALLLVLLIFSNPEFIPVSFDAGGVTTGPLTVPFILALGMGVSSFTKSRKTSEDSFGLVALASIGPIIAVLILGMIFR